MDHQWIIYGSSVDHLWIIFDVWLPPAPKSLPGATGRFAGHGRAAGWCGGGGGPGLRLDPTDYYRFNPQRLHISGIYDLSIQVVGKIFGMIFFPRSSLNPWLVAMHAFFILSTHFLGLHFDKFSRPASAWDQPVQVTGDVLRTSRSVAKDLCHSTVEAGPGATCVTQRDFPENLDGRHWAGSLLLSWVWSFRIFERPDTAESFLRNLLLSNLISPGLSIRCTWIRKHIPFSGMVFAIFRYSPINLNGANGVSFHYYINGYHHKTKSGVLGTTSKLRNWMRFFYELVSHIYCHSNFSTLW